ncbi:hypothetical protein [Arthrobacter sp. UM1]|uniref:hypothetical protein n=1 Tax=Arthrobacter sp. UM1 TaxID=2766776 RepID=UPI001CF6FE58|nr:hypothetical protein [Arthrobacter sp. UM1]MCB4208889.1 hypothetical protein [Arthrobacter sp. UM1]
MGAIGPYVDVLLPSVGIFLIFLFVYRAVIRSDKSERDAYSTAVREYREKHGVQEGERRAPSAAEAPAPSSVPRRGGAAAEPGALGEGRPDAGGAPAREGAAEDLRGESEDRRL